MSPPVCSACGQILSDTFYRLGEQVLCVPCGERLQDSGSPRRPMGFVLSGICGAIAGLVLFRFIAPRWGFSAGALAFFFAVAVSQAVAWFLRPAAVEGPRPGGNTMPPPDSGQV